MNLNGIAQIVSDILADGTIQALTGNPTAQFGTRTRAYLFAEVLPERQVELNSYTEEAIEYVTIIGNSGTRYSPVVFKGGARVGTMKVDLGDINAGAQYTAQQLETLNRMLGRQDTITAQAAITNWLDTSVNLALRELLEVQRIQALVDGVVVRRGANGYHEEVVYPNPAGHRVTISSGDDSTPEGWEDENHDIFGDLLAQERAAEEKGLRIARRITSTRIMGLIRKNKTVAQRLGRVAVINGVLTNIPGNVTNADINGMMAAEGMAGFENYDLLYRDSLGTKRFLRDTAVVALCATGRDQTIDLGDEQPIILPDTLGYTAIGTAVAQTSPGLFIRAVYHDELPPRLVGEGVGTALPVISSPEHVFILNIPKRDPNASIA